MKEAGVPDFIADNWYGVLVPTGTPKPVIEKLQRDIANATSERVRQRHYRGLIRYLQRAAIRDDVALASVGGAP